jgi:site-specific recombinase XerC
MADRLVLPLGMSLSSDIEVRADRATPYRARVRWVDPITKKRSSKSEAFDTRDAAIDWVTRMERAAARGVNPIIATTTLSEYGQANMTLALRGLELKTRQVPLIDPIRDLVERRIELAGHDPDARLFTGPKGGRITTATLRDATSWDGVVTELGYEQLKRHGLRHTGLTWLADAGVPVHILRKIAGHGTLTTTQRYLHPDRQSVTNAGDLLSRHLWSPNSPQLRVLSS